MLKGDEKDNGFINGVKRTVCEVWTRAMGYCRPVSGFNKGKQSEFKERKYFVIERKKK